MVHTRLKQVAWGRVQRDMRSMTANMQKFGQSITTSVTLPLAGMAALSVQAIKSAADLERLSKSFVSLTGGSRQNHW